MDGGIFATQREVLMELRFVLVSLGVDKLTLFELVHCGATSVPMSKGVMAVAGAMAVMSEVLVVNWWLGHLVHQWQATQKASRVHVLPMG